VVPETRLAFAVAPTAAALGFVVAGIAAGAGYLLVLAVGDRYLTVVGRLDYRWLSLAVLSLLVGVAFLFAGAVGVGVFILAGLLGLLPPRLGTRRVHLMGVLMGPLAL
jgi:putative membrane protein